MKILINKNLLLENLAVVGKAVSTRAPMPILECVLIKAQGSSVKVYGNDLELGIVSADMEATVDVPGSVAIEAKMLLEIVRKMPDAYIRIETDKSNVTRLNSGRTEFKVLGLDGEEFPLPNTNSSDEVFEVNASDFKDMIRQTIFSVAQDESKPVLTGELIEIKDGELHLVAVDGFRIAYRKSRLPEYDAGASFKAVVPAKTLNELARALPSEGEEKLRFYLSGNQIVFDLTRYRFISRLIEGEFIRYNQIFNEDHTTMVNISNPIFLDSIERVSLIARDVKKSPVKLSIGNDIIELSSTAEMGVSYDEAAADVDGNPLEIAFNPRFLAEALRAIGDEKVILLFTAPLSPCIIKGADNPVYKYLILPLRMKG
ncbi:MAG: DNA polymerase III subunit beta [Clostridiales bacterium]|jgi:DNA polymerase-3 subunit beta|nr:DNA polymerase III subunit beta [Clostridiales bacterium]